MIGIQRFKDIEAWQKAREQRIRRINCSIGLKDRDRLSRLESGKVRFMNGNANICAPRLYMRQFMSQAHILIFNSAMVMGLGKEPSIKKAIQGSKGSER